MTRIPLRSALVVVVGLLGCARLGPGVYGVVDRTVPGADELRLVYLGSGGWIIEHQGDMVLTAPLFSNPNFLETGLTSIEADTLEIDRYMSRYDVDSAAVILSGHAHYDHLMDVPRVAARHARQARILGNRTASNLLGSWSGVRSRIDIANGRAGDQDTIGEWLPYGPRIRVMPLRSHHAPHFDGYTLYQGTVDRVLAEPPRLAADWVDGETFAFLIDFLDDAGDVAFRVYHQDAVAAPPRGFAPDALIAKRPVDVAIFVPATFDQVDWHPEAFIENLQPRRVLLGHWEDFFVPIAADTKAIMLTDMRHFEARLQRVFSGEWWRPEVGTEFFLPR